MITTRQQQTLDRYINAIHELLQDQLFGIRHCQTREILQSRAIFSRMLGQMLYDAPKLHSGMVSVELIRTKLSDFSVRPCYEHHHGRQRGGMVLVNLIDQALRSNTAISRDKVKTIVVKFCQVHYTTAEENQRVKTHQQRCTSEAAYKRANIELVYAPDLFSTRGKRTDAWINEMQSTYGSLVAPIPPMYPPLEPVEWPIVIH